MTSAVEEMTAQTLEGIKKAQTSGINVSTGITGYDLSGLISLIPVRTPLFDRIARVSGHGADNASWKALTNVNNAQPNPFAGREGGGGKVVFNEQQVYAPYQPLRMAGEYTLDSRDYAKDYADVKAIAVAGTLNQWKIGANKAYYGAQAYPLASIGVVTLAEVTSGGTIPASTAVFVKAAARSGHNYYWGGSGIASAEATVTTAAAAGHSIVATVPAVRGALAYDWFVGGAAGAEKYLTTTTVNTLTVTAIPGANQPAPKIPGLSAIAPTAVPTADASFGVDSNSVVSAFNGLYAGLAGDYGSNGLITPGGAGTPSGAYFQSLDGGKLTLGGQGVAEIDNVLLNLFQNADLSPTAMIMGGQQSKDIASRIFSVGAASTYLQPDGSGRVGVTAGGSVAKYINSSAGGQEIDIVVDPHAPDGSIAFITDHVDYPNSGITNVFEARTLRDVAQWDYAVAHQVGAGGGPAEVWDVSSIETFVNRAPVACAVLNNIGKG